MRSRGQRRGTGCRLRCRSHPPARPTTPPARTRPAAPRTPHRPARAAPAGHGGRRSCDHTSRPPCPAAGTAGRSPPAGPPPAPSAPVPACLPAPRRARGCRNGCWSAVGRGATVRSAARRRPTPAGSR
ncbi:hypothetical protein G6F58_013414 [Rhizopus delemar]|nr:hypothetical protein G6F58_013414 [Rhizopus delemar]